MDDDSKQQEVLALTTEIVASFVGNNAVAMSDVPALIASVFQALRTTGQAEPEKTAATPTPAVPIKKSIQHDFIVCLEDGKKLKMGRVAGLVGIERRGSCWPWLVCSGGEVKHDRWLGKALPAVDLA
jgi:hypothetical protein